MAISPMTNFKTKSLAWKISRSDRSWKLCVSSEMAYVLGWQRFLGHTFWLHLLSCPSVVFQHLICSSLVVVSPPAVVLQLLPAYGIHRSGLNFKQQAARKHPKKAYFPQNLAGAFGAAPGGSLDPRAASHKATEFKILKVQKNSQENTVLHLLHCHAAEPSTPKSAALLRALEPSTCILLLKFKPKRMQQVNPIQIHINLCLTCCRTAVKSKAPTTI